MGELCGACSAPIPDDASSRFERLCGVVADRDIVTRAVADELPGRAVVGDVCSKDPVTVRSTRNEMPSTIASTRTGGTVHTGKCGWTRFGCLPSGNVHRVAVW